MADIKCDFCSAQPVTARYHAKSFVVNAFSTLHLQQGSEGDWAACAKCEVLIDTNQWAVLIDRVADTFYEQYPMLKFVVTRESFEHQLREMYAQLLQQDFRKVPL